MVRIVAFHRLRPRKVSQLVSDAMFCADDSVRAAACAAHAMLLKVSRSQTIALITAMQDPETNVAAAAYRTIIQLVQRSGHVHSISSIITAARRGLLSPAPILRYRIAQLTNVLGKCRLASSDRAQLAEIGLKLKSDPHYSVRSALL
jgi:hypothetical protein